jgi:hypothetical protein
MDGSVEMGADNQLRTIVDTQPALRAAGGSIAVPGTAEVEYGLVLDDGAARADHLWHAEL